MIRIGILGTADIAYQRFVPAIKASRRFELIGIARHNPAVSERSLRFERDLGVRVFGSFDELLSAPGLEAVYLPLPPALHAVWAARCLRQGLHVYLEKPFTTALGDTEALLAEAETKDAVVFENYMFQYHTQLSRIRDIMNAGEIGEVQLIRSSFCFPFRGVQDFRYHAAMGGGALLDAGGYVVRLADALMVRPVLTAAALRGDDRFDVDLSGQVVFRDRNGCFFQGYFSLDSYYQCAVEVLGKKGKLTARRIFTAPPDLPPTLTLERPDGQTVIEVPASNQFLNAIERFADLVERRADRAVARGEIRRQAEWIHEIQQRWQPPSGNGKSS